MKQKILKLSTVVLLLMFIGAGCQKDEIEYADEDMVVDNEPGIDIFKLKGDYINYIGLQLLPDGRLNAIPAFILGDPRIKVSDNGKIEQNFRWRLKSGYIVSKNDNYNNFVFTDITIQEYVDYNTKNGVGCWPDELIKSRIIDKNPFSEFYYLDGFNKTERTFTLGELNKMIEDGTLETVFTKLK